MRLDFLYGPPGAGKLTIARELATRTGMKLSHNHTTVDPVVAVFPFGSPSFGRLVALFRREVFAEPSRVGTDFIFTFVYCRPDDDNHVRALIAPVLANGGTVDFVHVTCSRDDLLSRVTHGSRHAFRRLTDPVTVADSLERHDLLSPLPFGESFQVNTTELSPVDAAAAIWHASLCQLHNNSRLNMLLTRSCPDLNKAVWQRPGRRGVLPSRRWQAGAVWGEEHAAVGAVGSCGDGRIPGKLRLLSTHGQPEIRAFRCNLGPSALVNLRSAHADPAHHRTIQQHPRPPLARKYCGWHDNCLLRLRSPALDLRRYRSRTHMPEGAMRRNGRSVARVAVALFAALLGIVLGTTSTAAREQPAAGARAAGGTICISLEWAMTPTRLEVGFVLANRGNTVWRGVFLPTAGSHGTVCEAGLPAGRYLVCEVAYGGYDIQLLPVPGQTAYESCIGLTLADGETETTAFRNVPLVPAAASQAIGTVRGHPLQVPGPLLHGELLR